MGRASGRLCLVCGQRDGCCDCRSKVCLISPSDVSGAWGLSGHLQKAVKFIALGASDEAAEAVTAHLSEMG